MCGSALDDVSRETLERLTIYKDLLAKWSPRINLVAHNTLEEAWIRHFEDSAQVLAAAPEPQGIWLDLGSGGGFPGLVIAILLAGQGSDTEVVLLESDHRKCAFLRTVLRETGITARVITSRIEEVEPIQASTISARALAPLDKLLEFATRHGTPSTTCLFQKGRTWRDEIEAAKPNWRFKHTVHQSITDPEAVVLRIEEIEHV
jgi:16S rRNA (guanine527-N7)-methyltransferase